MLLFSIAGNRKWPVAMFMGCERSWLCEAESVWAMFEVSGLPWKRGGLTSNEARCKVLATEVVLRLRS